MPSTPPAKDVPELQARTFNKLKRNKITPLVNRDLRLVNCAGNKDHDIAAEERLKNDLMQVLLSTTSATLTTASKSRSNPNTSTPSGLGLSDTTATDPSPTRPNFSTTFLSLTLTTTEPISIYLEQRLLPRLGSTLLGAKDDEDTLIPITLDLRELPMEATGIVCGVAGRLAQGATSKELGLSMSGGEGSGGAQGGEQGIDITFLSTAKAGTVLVRTGELERAVQALEEGMSEAVGDGS